MVFQQPLLLKWRRVIDNVLLPAEILGLPLPQSRERARDLLALVGLQGAEDKYPYELSGGMQQRASIAPNASGEVVQISAIGATQFVVQEAFETMLCVAASYSASLTPRTRVMSGSVAGAEMTTFRAPASRCFARLRAW